MELLMLTSPSSPPCAVFVYCYRGPNLKHSPFAPLPTSSSILACQPAPARTSSRFSAKIDTLQLPRASLICEIGGTRCRHIILLATAHFLHWALCAPLPSNTILRTS